jgi:D-alanine-D-alanine ligase-like ATP-grasp enzyme
MAIIISDLTPPPCEECGMGAIHHDLEHFSLRVDSAVKVISAPFEMISRPFMPLMDHLTDLMAPTLASFLVVTGLAVRLENPDEHSCETTQALWAEAKRRNIEMYEIRILGLPRKQFVARHGAITYAFQGIPRPVRHQKSISWIDDKSEMKKRFLAEGFPVAPGGNARTEKEAVALFHSLRKPVIVKPQEGSGGRHTTVNIETEEALRTAYKNACMVAPAAIVEEQLRGPVFRATLVDKKLAGVLQRDPPHVTGDGHSTIRELVDIENTNPLRRGPVFAVINIESSTAKRELARQHLTPESILAAGEKAYFHFKVNWGVGGTSHDVTAETHPDNVRLFEDIGAYLGDDLVGIDFMIDDITKSWRESERCGVIECNSLPLIGNHHFPFRGPVQNVAGAIWTMVFPKTQKPLV